MESVLNLIGVYKNFWQGSNQISVLKECNLQIYEGEMVCLIGPSGSGKTTVLQIAGLLDCPTSGKVLIAGCDASSANDEKRTQLRKNHIGFIYQFHHLMPEFSALENVALPLLIKGVSKGEAFLRAKEILQEVELDNRANFKPYALSGGQQQRVAIARAVIAKPNLILADEPTGNLDSELSHKIFSLLVSLTKRHKIACLVVSHNLDLAKNCDRILRMRDGNLIAAN